MQIALGSFTLHKAQAEANANPNLAYVRIVANQLTRDKEGERVLPEAFDEKTVQQLLDYGVFDWHHESKLGRTAQTRAQAVIGKPTRFAWEEGKPVFYGYLTKTHPIVQSMLPHLEADLPVFAASLGGTKEVRRVFDAQAGAFESQIPRMSLSHIAISHSPYVMNPGPGAQVSLVKAETGHELSVYYPTLDDYIDSGSIYEAREHDLIKALIAGTETNREHMSGHDAIRPESLEGADYHTFLKTIMAIKEGTTPATREGITTFLEKCNKPAALADQFTSAIDAYMLERRHKST